VIFVSGKRSNTVGLEGRELHRQVNGGKFLSGEFQEPTMAVFEWNQSYSVKVTQLDQQHQTLFQTISELQEALRVGHGKVVVGKVLQKLIDYTKSHSQPRKQFWKRTDIRS
jgi:hypothetical protein